MQVEHHASKAKADYAVLSEAGVVSLVRLKVRGILPTRFSGGDKAVDSVIAKTRQRQRTVQDFINRIEVELP
jgi:hypothetical protein